MAIANSLVFTLDVQQRNRLECLLVNFERSWHEGRLAECAAELPEDRSIRRIALVEMVKIDLERSWQSGRQPTVEEYVRSFPELLASDGIPLDLIQAEFEARRRAGSLAHLDSEPRATRRVNHRNPPPRPGNLARRAHAGNLRASNAVPPRPA